MKFNTQFLSIDFLLIALDSAMPWPKPKPDPMSIIVDVHAHNQYIKHLEEEATALSYFRVPHFKSINMRLRSATLAYIS